MRLIDADALRGPLMAFDSKVLDIIDNAPTIDYFEDMSIEQLMDECFNRGQRKAIKHGRWVEATREDPCYYVCSICGKMIDIEENYCPNCGTRMDEEVDYED